MATIDGVQAVAIEKLQPYKNNAKVHDKAQLEKIAASIKEFGFLNPILIDKDYNIIAGHGRTEAAKLLGMTELPAVYVEGLTDAQRRAYILADNRLTELGGWDEYLVQQELEALKSEGFDIELTGFELNIEEDAEHIAEQEAENPAEILPDSKCYIFAVSVFGTDSEKIVMFKIDNDTAGHVLDAINEKDAEDIVARIAGCLNDL